MAEVHVPDWEKVQRLVGLPDYGVAFCLSPWPDGGWMAGVAVTDADWVKEQVERDEIDAVMLELPETFMEWPSWDIIDGFDSVGITVHGDDAADAIEVLWERLHGTPDPPRRYQRERGQASTTAERGDSDGK